MKSNGKALSAGSVLWLLKSVSLWLQVPPRLLLIVQYSRHRLIVLKLSLSFLSTPTMLDIHFPFCILLMIISWFPNSLNCDVRCWCPGFLQCVHLAAQLFIFSSLQGRLLNLSCSTVPTFVLSITATTQVSG